MPFSTVIETILPGYNALTEAERTEFEATEVGRRLVAHIELFDSKASKLSSDYSTISKFLSNSYNQAKESLETEFYEDTEALLNELAEDNAYLNLRAKINLLLISEYLPEVQELTEEQQLRLAKMDFSENLLDIFTLRSEKEQLWRSLQVSRSFDALAQRHHGYIQDQIAFKTLEIKQKFDEWHQDYQQSEALTALRAELSRFQQQNRQAAIQQKVVQAEALARSYFERLAIRPQAVSQTTFLNLVKRRVRKHATEPSFELDEILKNSLDDALFESIKRTALPYFNFVKLDELYQMIAIELGHQIMEAAELEQTLDIDKFFADYQQQIVQSLKEKLLLINNKPWLSAMPIEPTVSVMNSLSKLFTENKTVENAKNFLEKLANTHAFIQATGFSTQNENSYLAILDIYNYARFTDTIEEQREILSSLFAPFSPIYLEYKDIAKHEKNIYAQITRILMPMLIVAAFTILVGSLLSSLAIAESAFIVALIPTLYIGACLAAEYVKAKTMLNQEFKRYWYGGTFEIPEFQINERMERAFGDSLIAQRIRELYINEIQDCDDLELKLKPLAEAGLLSGAELKKRQENIKLRHTLILEWYDIHSNVELGYESVPQIVVERLQTIEKREYEGLQKALEGNGLEKIHQLVQDFSQELKSVLSPQSEQQQASTQNSARFFKPSLALHYKKKAEYADELKVNIQSSAH